MHDIRTIRDNPAAFDAGLARRGINPMASELLLMDANRRSVIQRSETAQASLKSLSAQAGAAKKNGDIDAFEQLREKVAELKTFISSNDEYSLVNENELRDRLLTIPNLPYDDVPSGTNEQGNVEIRRHGAPRNFSFTPVEHYAIKAVAAQMDFETAAKLSGARFVVLQKGLARLERVENSPSRLMRGGNLTLELVSMK